MRIRLKSSYSVLCLIMLLMTTGWDWDARKEYERNLVGQRLFSSSNVTGEFEQVGCRESHMIVDLPYQQTALIDSASAYDIHDAYSHRAQSNDRLAGQYRGVARNSFGEMSLWINIKNDGGRLSGEIDTPRGRQRLSGTFADGRITIKFGEGRNEGTITAMFDGAKIAGEWNLAGQSGSLELRPVSERGMQVPQFPWPPPKASAFLNMPREFLQKVSGRTLLKDVADLLNATLEQVGYREKSWYSISNGFALVTRLEQLQSDGAPLQGEARWQVNYVPRSPGSVLEYLVKLFGRQPGFYRTIVFTVTDLPTSESPGGPNRPEALSWLHTGLNAMPSEIAELEFSKNHICTAYIYEFAQDSPDDPVSFIEPSRLSAMTHLEKSGIWDALWY